MLTTQVTAGAVLPSRQRPYVPGGFSVSFDDPDIFRRLPPSHGCPYDIHH